jgi:outer membrane biosynthesis protein TonB
VTDEGKSLLIVAAILSGASFTGGRMTAPAPPAEVRYVAVPVPPPLAGVPAAQVEPPPPAIPTTPVEVTPLPPPKVEAKPKEPPKAQQKAAPAKPRQVVAAKKPMPSCAAIKREFERMTWPERMDRYHRSSPEEIERGKYCLGF